MSARAVVDGDRGRQNDLAAIHIAKKALRLTDDEYRDVMATVCAGVRSSADLDYAMRKRFREHLENSVRRMAGGAAKARRPTLAPVERKMWALWMQLADAGVVQTRTMAALNAFALRQTGVDRIEWLNPKQQDLVIESLKGALKARGIEP